MSVVTVTAVGFMMTVREGTLSVSLLLLLSPSDVDTITNDELLVGDTLRRDDEEEEKRLDLLGIRQSSS